MSELRKEPILTPTEVEAILEASRSAVAANGVSTQAESVDLLASDRYLQLLIPALEVGHVRLAESLRKVFTSLLRKKTEVHHESPEIMTGRGLSRVADNAACLLGLRTYVAGEDRGYSVLALDAALTYVLVARLFGGAAAKDATTPQRSLTPLERRVLLSSLDPIVDALNQTLEPRGTFMFAPHRVECTLDLVPGFAPDVTVLHVPFTMNADGNLASISLALPASALEPLRAQLNVLPEPPEAAHREMVQLVRRTPVRLDVELGRARIGLRQLTQLTVGMVLRLDRHPSEELPVQIAGVTKFHGVPVHDDGALAIEISRRVD